MEDVQDLVEMEMPDHPEGRGEDEDEDEGAGQPGERRPGGRTCSHVSPLFPLERLSLTLQAGAHHRTRASVPPLPATWPRPSSEGPQPNVPPTPIAVSVSPLKAQRPSRTFCWSSDKQAFLPEQSLCTCLPWGDLLTEALHLPGAGNGPKPSPRPHTLRVAWFRLRFHAVPSRENCHATVNVSGTAKRGLCFCLCISESLQSFFFSPLFFLIGQNSVSGFVHFFSLPVFMDMKLLELPVLLQPRAPPPS